MTKERKPYELDDDLQVALKAIIEGFITEERPVRERQIRLWKKLEYYWAGYTRLWWNDVAHDWRVMDYNYNTDEQASYYDKPINVYRAYLESIIAALSSTVPGIKATPDDADNTLDVLTAKGANKIAELIYKHVDAPLLWVKALFVLCNQGMVAAYNYSEESPKYGTVDVAQYEDVEEDQITKMCPSCGMVLDANTQNAAEEMKLVESDEYDPGPDDVAASNIAQDQNQLLCPQCQIMVDPELRTDKIVVSRMVGNSRKPKARQCIEVNGGLFVRVPNYARRQEDTPYVGYCYETHFTNIYAKYPELRKQRDVLESSISSGGGNDSYERYGRLSPQYYGDYPKQTPTVGNWWIRPSVFEGVMDDDIRERLKKLFPDGAKVVFINNEVFAEAVNESLDDHWTLTYNPLSEYIHFDPLGYLLVNVQDITSDLVSLTLQTIEHGIPQTFIDPTVVDFNAYRESPATPGAIYPAKAKGGKNLNDSFVTIKTATLSQEVGPFGDKVNELGQLVSGALPSIWGGGGTDSRTASQYSMQRNQSLQRLQITWKMINFFWKELFGKVIPAYIKTMLDDERVVKEQHDSYVNVVIKYSQMQGKLGDIELDSSDEIPETLGTVKDVLMQMMQTGNPEILAAIASPENIPVLTKAIGLNDFILPGEKDREKQFEEINQLINSEPISQPSMNPAIPPMEFPSIEPEQDVDNHEIEAEICRSWLVGEAGRQAKVFNPNGYRNVLLHMKMHQLMVQQMMMQQQMAMAASQPQQPEGQIKPVGANNG